MPHPLPLPLLLLQGSKPVYRALDIRYDQCIGMCECLPDRDQPDLYFTVHFSCIQSVGKVATYGSEREMMTDLYHYGKSCTRWWFMKWYDTFKKAHGSGLPAPLWEGPEMPRRNETHDVWVQAYRTAHPK